MLFYTKPDLSRVGASKGLSEASIMVCTFLQEYSFMINLSIIIGFEEIESRSAFDVVASWYPIYP